MLEAVNTVLQNAASLRGISTQLSTVDSYAANPERTQVAAPQAPYVSPYIHMDVDFDKAVIQIRNGETGDVEGQFPSQSRLQEQARVAKSEAQSQFYTLREQAEPASRTQTPATTTTTVEPRQDVAASPAGNNAPAPTAQQQAAFVAAAQAGNTNASTVTVFA